MLSPAPSTLKRYGLTLEDWMTLYERQEHRCPICGRLFDETVKPCIDHLHVPRWKKLKPEERKKYVRGLLCIYDNQRILPKGMTLQKAMNLVVYLQEFQCHFDTVSRRGDDLQMQVHSNRKSHRRKDSRSRQRRQDMLHPPLHELGEGS